MIGTPTPSAPQPVRRARASRRSPGRGRRGHEVPRVVIPCTRSERRSYASRTLCGPCVPAELPVAAPAYVGGSSRLARCPAGGDPSLRSPNRRIQSNNSPRCCGNLRSVNGRHRIAFDSSGSGLAMRPTARRLTPPRWMRLAASLRTRSETHARRVERGQVRPPPTRRGVKPRPGSSSWRPARRPTGRVTTPPTHRRPTTAPTLPRKIPRQGTSKQFSLTINTTMRCWRASLRVAAVVRCGHSDASGLIGLPCHDPGSTVDRGALCREVP